jgi:hypothetical protein
MRTSLLLLHVDMDKRYSKVDADAKVEAQVAELVKNDLQNASSSFRAQVYIQLR